MQRERGFTLIELLITIGILAVVAGIALPAYRGYIATARNSEAYNNLAAIKLAEEEYFLEHNQYFQGASTAALASYWSPAETNSADQNFAYSVAAGSTGSINTSYSATAQGRGTGYKVPSTVVLKVGN